MASLNLDLDYFDHPKTKRLVGLLGKGSEILPIRLWCYCGKHHAEHGEFTGYSAQEIESSANWWGRAGEMVEAMVKVGFLEKQGETYRVHQWTEHAGHIHAFRARASEMAKKRIALLKAAATSSATSLAGSSATSKLSAKPRQGKAYKGEGKPSPKGLDCPFLADARFAEAWAAFLEMRKTIKKPATEHAQKLIVKKLDELSAGRLEPAIAILNQSILKNWQDVFPLKDQDHATHQPRGFAPPRETVHEFNERADAERRARYAAPAGGGVDLQDAQIVQPAPAYGASAR